MITKIINFTKQAFKFTDIYYEIVIYLILKRNNYQTNHTKKKLKSLVQLKKM